MSYCRNNGEDSEVYVIGTGAALECCGCRLYKYSFQTRLYNTMIKHLKYHRKIGDKVPIRAFKRLEEEQKTNDIYDAKEKRKLIKNIRKTKNELLEQKLYKGMEYHRKEMMRTALELFEDIYGRKPFNLELAGLAESASIKLDLEFNQLLGSKF